MHINSVKTHRITNEDDLETLLDTYILHLEEKSVLAITSKILSVLEGRYVKKTNIDKYKLVKQESDLLLKTEQKSCNIFLTIKDQLLIPSAGIDESNVDNVYVLYPSNPWGSAEAIWQYLRTKHKIKDFGVFVTDSHTNIMRKGVTGIALSWCGFEPLHSYIGKPDLYAQPLKVTQINIVDALATSAVFVMGEGNEQTPMAMITCPPRMVFVDKPPSVVKREEVIISIEEDLYAPILKAAEWEKTCD